jgi:MshEN domain
MNLPFLARESLGLDPTAAGLLSTEQALELRACVIGISNGGPLAVVSEPTTERLGSLIALLGEASHFAVVTESSLERLLEQRARVRESTNEVKGEAAAPTVEDVPPDPAPALSVVEVSTDDSETDALVAELEQATVGLSAARERIEQLAGARRGAEQMLADLNERLAGVDQERAREQEHSRDLQARLDAERERSQDFRRRLTELLAEFED